MNPAARLILAAALAAPLLVVALVATAVNLHRAWKQVDELIAENHRVGRDHRAEAVRADAMRSWIAYNASPYVPYQRSN